MSQPFSIEEQKSADGQVTLLIKGKISVKEASLAWQEILNLAIENPLHSIDLRELETVDVAGAAVIFQTQRLKTKKPTPLIGMNKTVEQLFSHLDGDSLFKSRPTLSDKKETILQIML